MPIRVSIADQQSALAIDRARVRAAVRRTLRAERRLHAEISVAIVDDRTIHELNRRHLQHDYPTDVLSFLLFTAGPPESPDAADASPHALLEGELIVSTETAIRQAAEYDWDPQAELLLYLVHGTLHLCGYDDHARSDRRRMRDRERDILQFWGLTPHYRD